MVQCLRGTSSDSMAVECLGAQPAAVCQASGVVLGRHGSVPRHAPRLAERTQPARAAAKRAKELIHKWTNCADCGPVAESESAPGDKRQRSAGRKARHGATCQALASTKKLQQSQKQSQGQHRRSLKRRQVDQQDQQDQQERQAQGCGACLQGSNIRWCTEQEQQGSEQSAPASEPQSADASLRMDLANAASAERHHLVPKLELLSDDMLRELIRSDVNDTKRKHILARVVQREQARLRFQAANDALLDEFRGALNPVVPATIHSACQKQPSADQFFYKIMDLQLQGESQTKLRATRWLIEVAQHASTAAVQRLNTVDGFIEQA